MKTSLVAILSLIAAGAAFAAVSHLPHLISFAFMNAIAGQFACAA